MIVFKTYMYSLLGICIYFIPIYSSGSYDTLINHMCDYIKYNHESIIELLILIYLVISLFKKYISLKNESEKIHTNICIYVISIIICIMLFSNEIIIINNDILLILEELILDIVITSFVSVLFISLIIDYGIIEFIESKLTKKVKKVLKVNASVIVIILMGIVTNFYVMYFIINKLYIRNKINQKECIIILLLYFVPSYKLIGFSMNELNIQSIGVVLISFIILFLVNIIVCRLYPINKKSNKYNNKKSKNINYYNKDNIFDLISNNTQDSSLIKNTVMYLEETISILIDIINKIIIIFLGVYIIEYLNVFYYIKTLINNIVILFNIKETYIISSVTIDNLFNSITSINSVSKSIINNSTSTLIFILTIVQTISLTSNILYINHINLDIKLSDVFIIYIQKSILIIIIYSFINYLYLGYTSIL